MLVEMDLQGLGEADVAAVGARRKGRDAAQRAHVAAT
jgi:hypothetical protein